MKKTLFLVFLLLFQFVGFAQSGRSPYPIIFVHGIDSDNTMWNDITNHLNLWFGSAQVVDLVLNASFDSTHFVDDVIIEFKNTPPLSTGNIFTVNFKNWWNENATDPMLLQGQNHGHILTQSQSNESSILKQGYALKLVIEKVLHATNSDGVILVGHSMGGLAIREYLQRKDENGSQMWWVDKNDVISGHMVKK
ncbi:MAG: alpha/beta hydrolase, partial [Chlorobiota bacterium]